MATGANCELVDSEWIRVKQDLENLSLSKEQGHYRIGVALIGLGRMGMIHLRNLLHEPRAHLLYCFDSDQKRLNSLENSVLFEEFNIRAMPSERFHLALEDPDVQAVVIATPTNFHEAYARKALQAGKNVMCEKPLTTKTESIMPLYQLANDKGVFLLCAFNRHYDPDFRQIRERSAQTDIIGCLQSIKITSRDCEKPPLSYLQVSGGIFHDSSIHDIDMSLWFVRQLPISVQVVGKTWDEYYKCEPNELAKLSDQERGILAQIDDYYLVIITMKFPNGSLCMIDNSREANYGYDQRCEVYGTKGTLWCGGRTSASTIEYTSNGIVQSPLNYTFASRYMTAYVNELRNLITMAEITMNNNAFDVCLASKRLMEPVRPALVVATHKVADACLEASKTGRSIELQWDLEFERKFYQEIN